MHLKNECNVFFLVPISLNCPWKNLVDILGDILAIFDFVIIPSYRVSLQILGSNYNRGINFVRYVRHTFSFHRRDIFSLSEDTFSEASLIQGAGLSEKILDRFSLSERLFKEEAI